MRKFKYIELHGYDQMHGGIVIELSENECLAEFGYKCPCWKPHNVLNPRIIKYHESGKDIVEIEEVLNTLGLQGWECFSIRAIQHWICDLPKRTGTDLNPIYLSHERQVSIWLKKKIDS